MKLYLWKRWKERRNQEKKLREQNDLLQTWAWLEKIFKSGLLSFDDKAHRLFVTQSFASLLMANGAEGWVNSIRNIYQYIHWRQTQRAWEEFFHKEELAAVRKALAAVPDGSPSGLTPADIARIKQARRQEIAASDMEPPKVEPFEFLIVPDSTEAKVEPIAIGYCDPTTGQMEVATWDEVKPLLQTTK